MKKKILISSGGSGGHIIPSMAFYDHLSENFDVILIIDKRGSKFINNNKYKYKILESPRLELNLLKFPLTLINLFLSTIKSIFILRNNKIDILLGTGGYMSVPICIAARFLNIKIYLFEPNMVLGRANNFLLKYCKRLFCYSESIINMPKQYKNKLYIINHILRKDIYNFKKNIKDKIYEKISLLVIGGSQGAKVFDDKVKNSIINLSKNNKIKVYHQTNFLNFDYLKSIYEKHDIECKIFDFEENIFKFIDQSNLVITRAGASTLSELAFLKVPFVAIPYKFATDDHQFENAKEYESKNCCWIIKENEFSNEKLTTLLNYIIENRDEYEFKKKNLKQFSYQNNWKNINKQILDLLNEN